MQSRNGDVSASIIPLETQSSDSHPYADSSSRGGSALRSSIDVGKSNTFDAGKGRDDFGQSRSDTWPSDKAGSLRGSANWNPSDDLIKDGTVTSGQPKGDLNASSRLEHNIAGDYNISGQKSAPVTSTVPSDQSFSTESVGGPGSTQTGSSKSLDSNLDSTALDSTSNGPSVDANNGAYLFHNNRAQGIGSAASGQIEGGASGGDLAQRVKATLTREATGTFGMMRNEVARNVQVSSHGSTIVLTGSVPSQRDKEMLEIRAREIAGVQRVDNQLTVAPDADANVRSATSGHDLEERTDSLQGIDQR